MFVKKVRVVVFLLFSIFAFCQSKSVKISHVGKAKISGKKNTSAKKSPDLPVVNENIPLMIPQKKSGKSGFINQKGRFVVQPEYDLAMFFAEDCNLLNSPNEKVRKFGTRDFATVEKNSVAYRINKAGKRVYQYKNEDLGRCHLDFKRALFHAYILNGKYGIIEDAKFKNHLDPAQFTIYPKYQYLYILEGNDASNPMIVATHNDKFGIIDINDKIVIPFEYSDIKRNYSWKLGSMFEVTKDDQNYYYIDSDNRAY